MNMAAFSEADESELADFYAGWNAYIQLCLEREIGPDYWNWLESLDHQEEP